MGTLATPVKAKMPLKIESTAINEAGLIYRAIYHPLRLKIIDTIHKAGKISVSNLNKKLKEDKSLLSQQLKILRDASILASEREGKQIYYFVNNRQIERIQRLSKKIAAIPKSAPIAITQRELESAKSRFAKPQKSIFSDNELQVIKLICEQKTSEEIGEKMNLSKRTVEDLRQCIIKKIGARNTVGLVLYAVKNGMVKI